MRCLLPRPPSDCGIFSLFYSRPLDACRMCVHVWVPLALPPSLSDDLRSPHTPSLHSHGLPHSKGFASFTAPRSASVCFLTTAFCTPGVRIEVPRQHRSTAPLRCLPRQHRVRFGFLHLTPSAATRPSRGPCPGALLGVLVCLSPSPSAQLLVPRPPRTSPSWAAAPASAPRNPEPTERT